MPIPNSDFVPDEFMPGCSSGAPNLAPGTPGAGGRPADDIDAGPVSPPWGPWQPGSRHDGGATSTLMPDQNAPSQIVPGPESGLTDTGAGHGSGSHYPRRSWQEGAS